MYTFEMFNLRLGRVMCKNRAHKCISTRTRGRGRIDESGAIILSMETICRYRILAVAAALSLVIVIIFY